MTFARSGASRPLVSVIIPCYNYGRFLSQAVQSVIEQVGVDVEIIIVDDASTDNSQSIERALAAADPRITLIEHNVNRGHIATYNDGIRAITGDYVVLLSADDLLAPGSLGRSTAFLEDRPDVGLVYGYAPEFTDDPPAIRAVRAHRSVWDGYAWIERMCQRGTNTIVNPEAIVRRSVMDTIVGYDPTLPHTADMDLWMRAAALAKVGRVNGPDQAYYRVHAANMHSTDFGGLLTDMQLRRDTFDRFFSHEGAQLPGAIRLNRRARTAIGVEALRAARLAVGGVAESGRSDASALAGFAQESWPGIEATALWRSFQRQLVQPPGKARRYLDEHVSYVRGAVRWRRWRRFGT